MPEFTFARFALACRRCGCRMLTKVGRAQPMLICTDCGQPVDQLASSAVASKRFWGALTLLGLATVGGGVFLLASMQEWRTATSPERGEVAAREEKKRAESPASLLEPSTLVRSAEIPVSAKASAAAAQQENEKHHAPEHQP